MKTALFWLAMIACLRATVISDGSGFFPVLVQVMKADGVTPAPGMSVRIADLPEYRETELDPNRRIKGIPDSFGKPVQTDANGCAVVFFHAKWGGAVQPGKHITYGQSLPGSVIVEKGKTELFRVPLKDWAKEKGYQLKESGALWITAVLKATN